MSILAMWWSGVQQRRKQKRLQQAFAVVQEAGLFVVSIKQRAGSNYLVDGNGVWHKLGR